MVSGNKDAFKALKLKHSAKHALTVGGVDVSVAKYELRPRTEKAVPLDVHADAE